MTDVALDIVQRSYVLRLRVQSLRGDEVLADDVPVAAGTLEVDRTLRVPDRATLTVPRLVDGVTWDPGGDPDHPLAPYGQTLVVELGVDLPGGDVEWLQRAELLVWSTSVDGDTVSVEAVGLLALVDEARFTTPYQASGTFQSTIRSLVEPALTVAFDAGLPTNRNVPTASLTIDDDRLGALEEVLDAWPAEAFVTASGVLSVVPATDPVTAALALSDGSGGTVVSWAGSASRDGAASLVVARGQDSAGAQVQGIAYDVDPASPLRYGGPFNPLPVPLFFESPLMTTVAQCQAAAATRLRNLRRSADRLLVASTVPHPGLEAGDLVTVDGVEDVATAVVERLSLPLTADGGPMGLALRVTG